MTQPEPAPADVAAAAIRDLLGPTGDDAWLRAWLQTLDARTLVSLSSAAMSESLRRLDAAMDTPLEEQRRQEELLRSIAGRIGR